MEIKPKTYPEGEEIVITQVKLTYTQESDTNSSEGYQDLNLQLEESNGGHYFVLSTERWAIDNIDELINVLKDFKERCKL